MPLLLEGTLSLLNPLDVHNLLINKKLHPIYDYFNTCTLIYIELELEKLKKLHPIYDFFNTYTLIYNDLELETSSYSFQNNRV